MNNGHDTTATSDAVDYAVIGAGIAGVSTAWRLAQAGHRVALLDRDEPANSAGSSHGSARILRYGYPDPLYARLLAEAEAGWSELEAAHGAPLITRTGCIDAGEAHDTRRLAGVFAETGVEHTLHSPEEAAARFGGRFAFGTEALWHRRAGVLDAEATVNAMVRAAVVHSANLLTGWEAASVTRRGAGYLVTAADGRKLSAGRVVVAAGGWLPGLLGGLGLPTSFTGALPAFEVRQESAFHFPYREAPDPADPWPTSIHMIEGMTVYTLPGGRDAGHRGQKVAEFNGGPVIPDASAQDGRISEARRARIVDYVGTYLPGLVPEPYAETTCLFTNTPDEDFVIDTCEGITVVSACSGHGAKFAPMLGTLAAGLATGERDVPAQFRPSR
ncbi:FAD-dependent oxidoreductase [Zhihengliuella salsuginis]|uniref:N-methyltryptophan oxidase n=1 Tax=Zhihengliuella salsuginis TaxID=578222 RepID=A0ABQ3GIT4_9MICC|nr:FAD-dependent oxidoreductase [Zhihengliuella salsuginis]GHD06341.1 N-methyltryptophan oxidase [Zhihengliuella salsuginis]